MAPQGPLNRRVLRPQQGEAGRHAGRRTATRAADGTATRAAEPVPVAAFVAVALACSALQAAFASRVFLFLDDFYFLGEARGTPLTWDYLSAGLFQHFSPITRLANWLVVGHLAAHPWLVPLAQGLMLAAVVCSATWLLVALFGRTVPALVTSVVLGVSLTLVPLGSWWTAAANILPGMAGFIVAFAASVLVLRRRSRWWAAAALLGAVVGVLDYETPILLPAYLLLWVLLFAHRISDEGTLALLRRTWWLFLGLIAVSAVAALNYRLHYYAPAPTPPLGDLLEALARSWGGTLVPTTLGLHPLDPFSTRGVLVLTAVVGWVVTVLFVGWVLSTRRGAWRGLVFAGLGWAVPTLAVLVNRLERYGPTVADDAIYLYLPTLLTLVGVVEAVLAPRRHEPRPRPSTALLLRAAVPTAVVAMLASYAVSVGPTWGYRIPAGAERDFVTSARSSAAATRESVGRFSVIDSFTHTVVMPEGYGRYSRDSNVLGMTVPDLHFDDPRPPFYRADEEGRFQPAPVEELARTEGPPRTSAPLQVRDPAGPVRRTAGGYCFTTTASTDVLWQFPQVSGDDLVVAARLTVDRTTEMTLNVRPTPDRAFTYPYPIDPGTTTLRPRGPGTLEIVDFDTLAGVVLRQFDPGVEVCLQSLEVGQVESATGP